MDQESKKFMHTANQTLQSMRVTKPHLDAQSSCSTPARFSSCACLASKAQARSEWSVVRPQGYGLDLGGRISSTLRVCVDVAKIVAGTFSAAQKELKTKIA